MDVLMRLQAMLLLSIVGLVLPIAGAPLRFCLEEFQLAIAGSTCSACEEHKRCGCDGDQDPLEPGCIAATRLLPEGVQPPEVPVPDPVASDLPCPAFAAPISLPVELQAASHPRDRGPPGPSRLYLMNQSLLL
jgi:hypothetical protein